MLISHRVTTALSAALLVAGLAACGSDSDADSGDTSTASAADETLTIYSGRNETLVGPLLEDLEEAVGTEVEVRYGDSAELAAQLLEEGERTEADLFFSQDAGALGALSKAGLLATLDEGIVETAPEDYRAKDGSWVGVSARSRVIIYNPDKVAEADLPQSVYELTDPKWKGQIGFAPTNASFQAFVTGMRVLAGEDRTREWLEGFKANEPTAYEGNSNVRDAVNSGEISLGLVNHYYLYEKITEVGAENVTARNHYLPGGDPGALVNVAGVGVLEGSDQADAAADAVEFLLGEQAQQYFADVTAEYPVREGITTTKHDLPELDSLQNPDIDLTELDSLEQTLALLDEVGLT